MSRVVKEKVNNWITIEITGTAGSPEQLWNTSIVVNKWFAQGPVTNVNGYALAPTSAVSFVSSIGAVINTQAATAGVGAELIFKSAVVDHRDNEDLKNWWFVPGTTGDRLIVVARLVP